MVSASAAFNSIAAVPAPHAIVVVLPSFGREEAGMASPRCLAFVSLVVYPGSLVSGHLYVVTLCKWQELLRRRVYRESRVLDLQF